MSYIFDHFIDLTFTGQTFFVFIHVWQQSFILARYNAFIVQWELNVLVVLYFNTNATCIIFMIPRRLERKLNGINYRILKSLSNPEHIFAFVANIPISVLWA